MSLQFPSNKAVGRIGAAYRKIANGQGKPLHACVAAVHVGQQALWPDEFHRNVGPVGTRCNHVTLRLTPNLEPVHVFAQVAISQGSRCVLCCPCFLAIFPWSWQAVLDPSKELLLSS